MSSSEQSTSSSRHRFTTSLYWLSSIWSLLFISGRKIYIEIKFHQIREGQIHYFILVPDAAASVVNDVFSMSVLDALADVPLLESDVGCKR